MVDLPDPTVLYRLRDGVYAGDLLIAAVAELDLFTWLATHGPAPATDVCAGLGLAERSGFVDVEHRPTAGDRGVLLARKPG